MTTFRGQNSDRYMKEIHIYIHEEGPRASEQFRHIPAGIVREHWAAVHVLKDKYTQSYSIYT